MTLFALRVLPAGRDGRPGAQPVCVAIIRRSECSAVAVHSQDKLFELAKGFRGRAKNCISITRERVEKALQYSYRDRRVRKRDARTLWIEQINAAARLHGVRSALKTGAPPSTQFIFFNTLVPQLKYSQFIFGLKEENVGLNRKVLSEIARYEPLSFKARPTCCRRWSHALICSIRSRLSRRLLGEAPPRPQRKMGQANIDETRTRVCLMCLIVVHAKQSLRSLSVN